MANLSIKNQNQYSIDKAGDNNKNFDDFKTAAFDNSLNVKDIDEPLSELYPRLKISEHRWHHCSIRLKNLCNLHELVDMYGLVVIVIQL